MVLPVVMSVLHSVKTTAEASALAADLPAAELSLASYQRLWDYQAGLPRYLFNSFGTAFLAIVFTLLLTVPAGYASPGSRSRPRSCCSCSCSSP